MAQRRSDIDEGVAAAIARIVADHERGAAELAESGVELLEEACEQLAEAARGPLAGATLLADLEPVAACLLTARPSMAPIGNAALAFLAELERRAGTSRDCRRLRPWRAVRKRLESERRRNLERLVRAAADVLLGLESVLTLSYSSTVMAVLERALARSTRIVVAESRPRLEGRRVVEALLAQGREVRCITDAELALFAARVDALIIGADSVTSDLAVVNKVGSAAAAWGARSASRPCYVAVDTSKIAPRVSAAEIELEEKSGAEIWPERAEVCSNVYFEAVPAKLITAYLTERGVLNHDGMAAEVVRMARLHERRAGP